jgi:nitrate/nitrite transport system permease protein
MTARVDRAHPRAKFNPLNFLLSFLEKNRKKIIRPLFALFIILVIWQLLCLKPDGNFPGPIKVIQDTLDSLIIHPFFDNGGTDKGLFLQVFESLKRVAIGFSFSAGIGIALGILVGTNPFMFDALDPIFQVLRTISPLAWLPIALAIFQQFNPLELLKISTSETSALFVIFITSIWPILINTTVGVQQIPQDYRNVARVCGNDDEWPQGPYWRRFKNPLLSAPASRPDHGRSHLL